VPRTRPPAAAPTLSRQPAAGGSATPPDARPNGGAPERGAEPGGDAPGDVTPADAVREALALRTQAHARAEAGRPADAVQLLRQALRVLPLGSGGLEATEVRTRVLITLAYAEAEVGSTATGLVHLGTASDLLASWPDGSVRVELQVLIKAQHALILHRAGQSAESIALHDEAIELLQNAGDVPVSPILLPGVVMNRGLTHIAAGRPVEAEADMRLVGRLADERGLPLVKAKALGNLGDVAKLTGDVPGALRYYAEAELMFRDLAPDLVPRTQIDQGTALLAAGLADEAAEQFDLALPQLRRNRAGQDLAEAELARAGAALLQGDLEQARLLAGSAQRRFARRGSRSWAEVAALTKMRAEAVAVLRDEDGRSATPGRAAKLAGRLGDVGLTDEASMAKMLGARLAVRRGSLATARALVAQVARPGHTTPVDHRMLLRLCRAELSISDGDRAGALAEAGAGLTELGRVRDRMGGLDLLSGTAVHGRELGELAVGLALAGSDAREAFAWLERTRAQVYRYEPLPAIDDPVLADRVAEARSVSRALQQARLEGRSVAELEARDEELQREVARLGWYTSRWGRPRPVCTADDVVPMLGERALISFTTHGEELSAVVLTSDGASLVRLGAAEPAAEIARQLHADLDVLAPDHLPQPLVDAVTASAARRAEALDAVLIGPLAELVGSRELVVVPTGSLYAVPWGALPSLRGRPVVVAPSATAWLTAARGAADSGHRDGVVLVGGPDLPEGVGEVRRLRTAFPDATLLDGHLATVGNVVDELDGSRLAHVAAHGVHKPDNALFSRLELADGPLFAHELSRLGQVPERVVLAACELALSHIRPGDEALGFAGALLASGSHTVVAAVNRVGDRAAAETMDEFHRLVSEGKPVAHALAEATALDPLRRPFVCLGAS
jgi:tetratricopeptide (TPR) repeat protein